MDVNDYFMRFGYDPELEVFLPDVVAVERDTQLVGHRTRMWMKNRTISICTFTNDPSHVEFLRRWKNAKVEWERIPPSNDP